MKTITLLNNLETPDGFFKTGETVEVSDELFDYLMDRYREQRQVEAEKNAEAKKFLEGIFG
jgi:hypothetical protein